MCVCAWNYVEITVGIFAPICHFILFCMAEGCYVNSDIVPSALFGPVCYLDQAVLLPGPLCHLGQAVLFPGQ